MRLEYYDYDSKLWIHLDDGRVLEIEGYSYEDVDLQHRFLTLEERRKQEHERQGARERRRNNLRNEHPHRKPVTLAEASSFLQIYAEEMMAIMNRPSIFGIERQVYGDGSLEIEEFRGELQGPDEPDEKSV